MATEVQHFFDPRTSTLTYVVFDRQARTAVVIDPVLDFDPRRTATSDATLEPVFQFIRQLDLAVPFALDTHAHADHMTGLNRMKETFGSKTVIGSEIVKVQKLFRDVYNLGQDFPVDGSQFDVLLSHGDEVDAGPFTIKAHHCPGHTPACSVWQIENMIFVGDVLFMPDHGTARCDFPGGSASDLYRSIRRLYELPGETEVYTGHDYQPGGRELAFRSTVEAQRSGNKQLTLETTVEQFLAFRRERDATLALPNLMLAVLPVNIRAGRMPEPESNGTRYLKLPLNVF